MVSSLEPISNDARYTNLKKHMTKQNVTGSFLPSIPNGEPGRFSAKGIVFVKVDSSVPERTQYMLENNSVAEMAPIEVVFTRPIDATNAVSLNNMLFEAVQVA